MEMVILSEHNFLSKIHSQKAALNKKFSITQNNERHNMKHIWIEPGAVNITVPVY